MKKIILSVAALTVGFAAFGQKNPLKRAENELGKGDLVAAKASIEEALTNEKTKDEADVWLVRGNIYRAMMKKGDEAAFEEVVKSYKKFEEVGKKGFAPVQADTAKRGLYAQVMNEGFAAYNDKNWTNALKGFDRGALVMDKDTTALYNYVMISEMEDPAKIDKTKVIDKSLALTEHPTYSQKVVFFQKVIGMYLAEDTEDKTGKATALLDKALVAYPTNQQLMATKIDLYIRTNRTAEAIKSIEQALPNVKENKEVYLLNLGILYEKTNDIAKAEETYKKLLENNPNYYDALVSLSALYTNKDGKLKKYNEMDYKKLNTPEGKQLVADIKALYVQALPYLEKAATFTDKPEYGQVLNALKTAYSFTEQKDKVAEVQAKIDALYK